MKERERERQILVKREMRCDGGKCWVMDAQQLRIARIGPSSALWTVCETRTVGEEASFPVLHAENL